MININEHVYAYTTMLVDGLSKVNREDMDVLYSTLQEAMKNGLPIYVCGNGGSAAIAQHFACDHSKGVHGDCTPRLMPNVTSLSTNVPLITAIANDIDFTEIYAHQIDFLPEEEGVLIAVSSSGNSPNIVKALERAKKRGMATVSFTGFDGGKAAEIAHINIHVPIHNYGVVEDAHQMIMHCLSQALRMNNTDKKIESLKL